MTKPETQTHSARPRRIRLWPSRRRLRIYGVLVALLVAALYFHFAGMPRRRVDLPLDVDPARVVRLTTHVRTLAETIGARSASRAPQGLERAAVYVSDVLQRFGYTVREQRYECADGPVRNVWVELPGRDPHAGIVLFGAHYDGVRRTAAVDDNASGTALLLELAADLVGREFERTVHLVAFTNEEPPYFKSEDMGSLVYAKRLQSRSIRVHRMVSLESLGYFSAASGSQRYPPGLSLLYPSEGNFVAVVGGLAERATVIEFAELLLEHSNLRVESASLPGLLPGVDWSDHWSFWQTGAPAIMLTDTAVFRNPSYHQPGEVVDSLDFDRMADLSRALTPIVARLAID